MIRIQALYKTVRYILYGKVRPSVGRFASNSSMSTRDGHEPGVKSFDEIPEQGTAQTILTLIRKGGTKNLFNIQSGKFEKFGPIFKEKIFGKQTVHVADADAFAFIAQSEGAFPKRDFLDIEAIFETQMYVFLGNDQERWKTARSPIASSFLLPNEVRKFAPGIDSVAKDAVKRLRRQLKDGKIGELKHEVDGYTTENIILLVLGERMGFYDQPQNPKILEFIQTAYDFSAAVVAVGMSPPIWRYVSTPAYRKIIRAKERLFIIAEEFAEIRRAKEQQLETSDDISLFSKITSKGGNAAVIHDVAVALCQAGVETTSSAFRWCLYHLAINPKAQEKAYQEIVSIIGTSNDDKSLEDPQFHSRLSYLKVCIKESMRLTPSVFLIARNLEKDTTICGYNVPAESKVIMWFSYLASNTKVFNNPEQFNPERWFRGSDQEKIPPFATMPFGFGVRMCLGRRFAEMELAIGLARIIQSFRLHYVGNDEIKKINLQGLFQPNEELPIKFIERKLTASMPGKFIIKKH